MPRAFSALLCTCFEFTDHMFVVYNHEYWFTSEKNCYYIATIEFYSYTPSMCINHEMFLEPSESIGNNLGGPGKYRKMHSYVHFLIVLRTWMSTISCNSWDHNTTTNRGQTSCTRYSVKLTQFTYVTWAGALFNDRWDGGYTQPLHRISGDWQ
jgi:hypothetical protein